MIQVLLKLICLLSQLSLLLLLKVELFELGCCVVKYKMNPILEGGHFTFYSRQKVEPVLFFYSSIS